MTDIARKLGDMHALAGASCDPEYSRVLLEAKAEIERLRAVLEQVAIVCTDNMDADCDHRMALDFVRQIANLAYGGWSSALKEHGYWNEQRKP